MYPVSGVSGAVGVNVADAAPGAYAIVPATLSFVAVTRIVIAAALTVAGSSGSLNVSVAAAAIATPTLFGAGTDDSTVGPVRSGRMNVDCAVTADGGDVAEPAPFAVTV